MGTDVPGSGSGEVSGPPEVGAEDCSRSGRETWRSGNAPMVAELLRIVDVMQTVTRVEMDVAKTLQALSVRGQGEVAARRLRLAGEAIRGANTAIERSKHLQRDVYRRRAHGDEALLCQFLDRAAAVLDGLASAENEIAGTLMSSAGQDRSELAEQRRQLAQEALAGARRATAQARVLRELAEASATREPPC